MLISYQQQTLLNFKRLTKIDLELYFFKVELFLTSKRSDIVDYYKGNTRIPQNSAFSLLEECLEDSYRICNAFRNQKKQLDHLIYWDLLEQIQDLRDSLESTAHLYKYLKSYLGKYNYTNSNLIKITLAKGNTLENVGREVLGQKDWDNDWQQIAFRNDLTEEDYGSKSIEIELDLINQGQFKPNVVIDSMQGDNCLGKDFLNKITFTSIGSILKTGTISGTLNSNEILGIGTVFISELAIGDIILQDNKILGIIQSITSDNVLILDRIILKAFTNISLIISESEDFVILSPQQTVQQSAETLLLLKQKDNPEFPYLGQNLNQSIGVARSVFSLPSITRSLNTVFATDDTFSGIAVTKLEIIEDTVSAVVDITTIKNDIVQLITLL